MKIVVDAMGGDFAPKVNVDGAIDALREYADMEIVLAGPQALIEETIAAYADAQALSARAQPPERCGCARGHFHRGAPGHGASPQEELDVCCGHGHCAPRRGAGVCLRRVYRRADGGRNV